MFDLVSEAQAAALIGLLGGIALGLAARIGRFCTLGAIEDALYSTDDRRLRMWGIAIGVAVIGAHVAMDRGWLDATDTVYLSQAWNPLETVIGGLIFGYGMAMAGNCGYGALARLGGGDLRSLVIVIVMGFSAAVVISGPLALPRVWVFPVEIADTPQSLSHLLDSTLGIPALLTGLAIGAAIFAVALANRGMLRSPGHIVWGAVVGLAVVSGWVGTYWIFDTGFGLEPIESHTFAGPIADTLFYGMTASGNAVSFSVGSVSGVIIGAFLGSAYKGHLRWEACEDPRELRRQIGGAALMGAGAVLAVGCSVGQGLSAFSLLAYSAPVALLSIFAGAALGLRHLIEGIVPAE